MPDKATVWLTPRGVAFLFDVAPQDVYRSMSYAEADERYHRRPATTKPRTKLELAAIAQKIKEAKGDVPRPPNGG